MSEPLVLVGMLDSPFVRRVAIALELAHLPYDNLPLRTMADADRFSSFSPLRRAPTLVLPSGDALFDSHLILTYLAEQSPAVAALLPAEPALRLRCYQVMGAASGLADKALSTLYEKLFHPPEQRHLALLTRAEKQFSDTLSWLEQRAPARGFLTGDSLSLADITLGTAIRFAREAHPDLLSLTSRPAVSSWCDRLETLPEFSKTYLALAPPSSAGGAPS